MPIEKRVIQGDKPKSTSEVKEQDTGKRLVDPEKNIIVDTPTKDGSLLVEEEEVSNPNIQTLDLVTVLQSEGILVVKKKAIYLSGKKVYGDTNIKDFVIYAENTPELLQRLEVAYADVVESQVDQMDSFVDNPLVMDGISTGVLALRDNTVWYRNVSIGGDSESVSDCLYKNAKLENAIIERVNGHLGPKYILTEEPALSGDLTPEQIDLLVNRFGHDKLKLNHVISNMKNHPAPTPEVLSTSALDTEESNAVEEIEGAGKEEENTLDQMVWFVNLSSETHRYNSDLPNNAFFIVGKRMTIPQAKLPGFVVKDPGFQLRLKNGDYMIATTVKLQEMKIIK